MQEISALLYSSAQSPAFADARRGRTPARGGRAPLLRASLATAQRARSSPGAVCVGRVPAVREAASAADHVKNNERGGTPGAI